MSIKSFIDTHYKHFNAASLRDAAIGYCDFMSEHDNKMLVTLGGAMSTAELGISLAEMIRKGLVHAISCTGANLEEDLFNLVAHYSYERIPNYRELSPHQEKELLDRHLNRVTDTCIPEFEAIRKIEKHILKLWKKASLNKERYFPHEYFYQLIQSGALEDEYEISPSNSWLYEACKKELPIYVAGWEDSTLGNIFASQVMEGEIDNSILKTGIEYMIDLAYWYSKDVYSRIGFFQIGGGIAGDFPICVVPMLQQDLNIPTKLWGYFCQISDSTTSYGSYSGATPNEKITWGKLGIDTPKYVIESDATIVAPLIFQYVLDYFNGDWGSKL